MIHKLPKLPYEYDALEPYLDGKTMRIHHTKHHQAYVDNLNNVLKKYSDLKELRVEEILKGINNIPKSIQQTVINNAGGHANHKFFWQIMNPPSTNNGPVGKLKKALENHFGSIEKFKEEFTSKALGTFGSGWAFLILTKKGQLKLKRHSFQNSPLMHGNIPILGIDLWEHAYYLNYQNRRVDYIKAWWNVVNWDQAEKNLSKTTRH